MEKRVIIAIALCIGFLVVWTKLVPGPKAPPPPPPAPAAAPSPEATPPTSAAAPAGPAAAPTGAPAAAGTANHPEHLVELITPDVRFVFSSLGGTLLHADLRDAKFLDRTGDSTSGHDVIRTFGPKDAPFRTTFPQSGFETPADGAWEVSQPAPDAVVFAADVGAAHIEKRYKVDPARFRLHLDVVVANRGDKPIDHHLTVAVSGRQDPEKKGGGFLSGPASNLSSALCMANDDRNPERQQIDKLAKDPFQKEGNIHWIGTDEKFFLVAAVPFPEPPPPPESPPRQQTCKGTWLGDNVGQVALAFQERTVAPRAETSYPFDLFVGPKFNADLEDVRPAGQEVNLEKSIDVSIGMLSRPILSLLKFFHRFAHNWGLAIVLLTLFIKLITFYPTQRSLLSAKKMQKLAPKLNAIRKKYENDRQRQSVETMNLYKAHGVSPFGGCLPSLIQMPIWIALYSTLNYAVELYRAPFFGHIHDLTAKDPFYITPLVMGGLMFLQMKMSPSGADSQQQAMMAVMMPIMFTGFSLFLPSGLAVYMLTSYLIGIVQQLYVNHVDRKSATA
jgi:YidC/Oxa1 family membrane protein insertase